MVNILIKGRNELKNSKGKIKFVEFTDDGEREVV